MVGPLVSVLIPTFNRSHYLPDAIGSALSQTLDNIEVVVVDDGSTDRTIDLLGSFTDPRLRVLRHDHNRGIPAARNTALSAARGRYIAWLDSDDRARPTRLAEQVTFLERNPAVAMVGSCAGKLHADGRRKSGVRVPPLTPSMIQAWLLFRSAFQQSSIMGRADILSRYGYDAAYPCCEDVDMFLRLQRDHRLANLPQILVDRRVHPDQCVRLRRREIEERRMALAIPMLAQLGIEPSGHDLERHVMLGRASLAKTGVDAGYLDWARGWLERLRDANRRQRVFDPESLALASDYFWLLACRAVGAQSGKPSVFRAMLRRPPSGLWTSEARDWIRAALPIYLRS
ncbi:glycosyltransferase family 2 protein [uncultured Sphingomonas sp.]|uniref:glycosyltransferase family 2 protein n=1 Tax=uncultured Sphingomonas sp. TaxID=158754 RepID=UPI0035CB8A3E